jgi:hypothetical protein
VSRGWWRRNLWGLIAVLPLTAGVFAVNADLLVERNLTLVPRQPIVVAAGQSVEYADADLRLVSLTPVEPRVEVVGRGNTLPAGLTIWQAVIDVDPHSAERLAIGCKVFVEDAQGRLFGNGPSELKGTEGSFLGGLSADNPLDLDAAESAREAPFTSTSYFVLPAGIQPAAVRLTYEPALPRYVRFTA